jgi:hypothetical protein
MRIATGDRDADVCGSGEVGATVGESAAGVEPAGFGLRAERAAAPAVQTAISAAATSTIDGNAERRTRMLH